MPSASRNKAIISWIPQARGGRRAPPNPTDGYSTVARFENDAGPSRGHWSVILRNTLELNKGRCIAARIEFLSENAPLSLLAPGERFELVEGAKVVAKGVVVSPRAAIPRRLTDFSLALLG